ncbi:unnamed protein product, partial [Porites evermanni]
SRFCAPIVSYSTFKRQWEKRNRRKKDDYVGRPSAGHTDLAWIVQGCCRRGQRKNDDPHSLLNSLEIEVVNSSGGAKISKA